MTKLESLDKLREWALDYGFIARGDPYQLADEIQAEIDSRYMLLPVDADGVPIRVGEKVAFRSDAPVTVMSIGMSQVYGLNDCGFYGPAGNFFGKGTFGEVHHVKPRTVEDVLEDFIRAYDEWDDYSNGDDRMRERELLFSRFADELQMRGDAE